MMQTYHDVDYLALHKYILREGRFMRAYLAMPLEMEARIHDISATCDYVKFILHSNKVMKLNFDEFVSCTNGTVIEPQPWMLSGEERDSLNYPLAEALVFGVMLITLLRHSNRVKMACQSILINCVPLMLSKKAGPVWANTTYYPMLHVSQYGRGVTLHTRLEGPRYDTGEYGFVPAIDHVAIYHEGTQEVDVFAVNRSDEPIAFAFYALDFAGKSD